MKTLLSSAKVQFLEIKIVKKLNFSELFNILCSLIAHNGICLTPVRLGYKFGKITKLNITPKVDLLDIKHYLVCQGLAQYLLNSHAFREMSLKCIGR